MGTLALLLCGAALVCLVFSIRDVAALMFAAAVGFWALPLVVGGPEIPAGFEAQDEPQPAPETDFRTAGGKHLTLADFRGRVVLLNLWTMSCDPCQTEIPSFDRLQAMYKGDGLAVLAVSVDDASGLTVRRYLQRNGLNNLTPYLDAQGATAMAFNLRQFPTTLLIDRDGNVVGSLQGATQWDSPEALALIRRYLDS
ncbi:MAG TPA: TlpA disulfide reductase family protein [Candidatus Acidoferrum sp.]|nr:TlpA disulfide reductase family protein [Candidatus Acidoferrum sp.]